MKKVVINKTYGGFDLSDKATQLYLERKYPNSLITRESDKWGSSIFYIDGNYWIVGPYEQSFREDPILVTIVEDLKEEANGNGSRLKIVEIPDDVKYTITDYDGVEKIEEVHREWH